MSISLSIKSRVPLRVALLLTLGRIFISPFFLIVYLNYQEFGLTLKGAGIVLLSLLVISELTDFFDGFIARKWDQVTDLGKILDPMADSIARISVFLTFTQGIIQLPLLLVFVFLYRDVIISMLRTLCALRGVTLAARTSGKIKAVLQGFAAIAIVCMIIAFAEGAIPLDTLRRVSLILTSFVALYTFLSGVEYIWANRQHIRKTWALKK